MIHVDPAGQEATLVRPTPFDISFWGIQISGHGVIGILAAVAVVAMFVIIYRF